MTTNKIRITVADDATGEVLETYLITEKIPDDATVSFADRMKTLLTMAGELAEIGVTDDEDDD